MARARAPSSRDGHKVRRRQGRRGERARRLGRRARGRRGRRGRGRRRAHRLFTVPQVRWAAGAPPAAGARGGEATLEVQVRHAPTARARARALGGGGEGGVEVELDARDLGLAPGQYAAFYAPGPARGPSETAADGGECLGAGPIGDARLHHRAAPRDARDAADAAAQSATAAALAEVEKATTTPTTPTAAGAGRSAASGASSSSRPSRIVDGHAPCIDGTSHENKVQLTGIACPWSI